MKSNDDQASGKDQTLKACETCNGEIGNSVFTICDTCWPKFWRAAGIRASSEPTTEPAETFKADLDELLKWSPWFKNGRYSLYHAIDGDGPTMADWARIGDALARLRAGRRSRS